MIRGSKDEALSGLHEDHRKVIAERGTLQRESIELQAKNAEAIKRLRDTERQIEAAEGRLADTKSKLARLAAGIAA